MESLCKVCLSSDRKLFPTSTSLAGIMKMIIPEVAITKLCWECLASVKHLLKLRKRALNSKDIIDKHFKVNKSPMCLQSSSNLGTCYIFTFSLGENSPLNIDETKLTKSNFYKEPLLPDNTELNSYKPEKNAELGLPQNNLIERQLNNNDKDSVDTKVNKNLFKNVKSKQKKVRSKKKRVKSNKEYSCSECKEKFESRGKYEYHRQKHRGRVQCTACSQNFSSRSSLATHHTNVHSAIPRDTSFRHYCQPCNTFYKTSCSYNKHLRTSARHIDPKILRFRCPSCGKGFAAAGERDRHHETVHLQRNRLQCARCPRQYCSTRALRSHIRRRHVGDVTKRDFMCEMCGFGFKTAQVLRGHQRIHEKEKSKQMKNICSDIDSK